MEGRKGAGADTPAIQKVRHEPEVGKIVAHKPYRRRLDLPAEQPAKKATPDPRSGKQTWAKFYLGDWLLAVTPLSSSHERHALRLYIASVGVGGPLRDSPKACQDILELTRWQWKRVRRDLIEAKFIHIEDGAIVVPLAQTAIANFERRSFANRQNALGGRDAIEEADE